MAHNGFALATCVLGLCAHSLSESKSLSSVNVGLGSNRFGKFAASHLASSSHPLGGRKNGLECVANSGGMLLIWTLIIALLIQNANALEPCDPRAFYACAVRSAYGATTLVRPLKIFARIAVYFASVTSRRVRPCDRVSGSLTAAGVA